MDLNEQARVVHDQLTLNRVAQACVTVALDKRGPRAKRVLADPDAAARRAVRILAASDDVWLDNDTALLANLRATWRRW